MLVLNGPLALSTRAFTEDQLVEQPAIGLFAEFSWHAVPALEESPRDADSETT
jgi:hypothetical protein